MQDAAKKISMGPILFSYYEESLVPSNLNSKLFRFHSAHPNLHISIGIVTFGHLSSILYMTQVIQNGAMLSKHAKKDRQK